VQRFAFDNCVDTFFGHVAGSAVVLVHPRLLTAIEPWPVLA
jgi:hypothetical protein